MPVRLVVDERSIAGLARRDVVRRAGAMLAALQMPDAELSIVLTGDDQIRKLNRMYRKKDRATDVLAFAQREGELGELAGALLGDVVVSVPTARRQAAAAGRDVRSEVMQLLAHGLLHLLGWDHDTPAADRRMRRETDRLCAAADAASRARDGKAAAPRSVKGGSRRRANGDSSRRGAPR